MRNVPSSTVDENLPANAGAPARPRGGGARPSLGEVSARDPMLPHHSGPPSSQGPPSESRPQFCPQLGLRKPWGRQSSSPALEPHVAGCLLPSGAVPTLHPQERCPPSTAGTTPACPAPSLTTLSPRAQECLPGFWSCGCPPAPTQPLVSPWLVPGLPGQARNRRVGPGSLHSWLHDQERSGNERQPEWDRHTDRQAEAERGGRVETPW